MFLPQSLYDSVLHSTLSSGESFKFESLLIYACMVAAHRMEIVPDKFIPTLVLACLCSSLGQHSPKLRNKPIPDAAIVNCALQFACLVEHAYYLASLLGLHGELPLPSRVFKASLYVPLHMMASKEQVATVSNDELISFYRKLTDTLPDEIEQFCDVIRHQGDDGGIAEFEALFGSSREALGEALGEAPKDKKKRR